MVYAFLQYLLATFRKMVTRGFIKAPCQLTILLLFVEAARSVLLLWRFMTHRKEYKQRQKQAASHITFRKQLYWIMKKSAVKRITEKKQAMLNYLLFLRIILR
ncbi:hypothetical protein DWW36_09365 [Erysipelotrichaceae bacterium AF15-26LB]|nr:hypothetical protein DWW36_09365 [Erysipelotrichaceae bacterium AF15-26LB]RJV90405.1 hypothetical protein DWX45_08620 [Erysipelotrichaceae bacterium AF19-24AC]